VTRFLLSVILRLPGVYNSHTEAEASIKQLEWSGFDLKKLSIVGKDYHTEEHVVGYYTASDRMKARGGARLRALGEPSRPRQYRELRVSLFELDPGNGGRGLPITPEIACMGGASVLCLYGADEHDSPCPRLAGGHVKAVSPSGGHHFGGDYPALKGSSAGCSRELAIHP